MGLKPKTRLKHQLLTWFWYKLAVLPDINFSQRWCGRCAIYTKHLELGRDWCGLSWCARCNRINLFA